MNKGPRELKPEELTFTCDPNRFEFETTADLVGPPAIIGQDRAVRAIDFGIEMTGHGFNIYAMGCPGTGRTTTIRAYLERKAPGAPVPDDWCYVYNFSEPSRPNAIRMPAGTAHTFKKELGELIEDLKNEISQVFSSEDYDGRRAAIVQGFERKRADLVRRLETDANGRGFALMQTVTGLVVAPMVDGQVLSSEDYAALPEERRRGFEVHRDDLQRELDGTTRAIILLEREARAHLRDLDREVALSVVQIRMEDLVERYSGIPEVGGYLEAVRKDVVENVESFKSGVEQEEQEGDETAVLQSPRPDPFIRYKVNVIVSNADTKGAPVVFETNPTYYNLGGSIEYDTKLGTLITDFMHILAGSLHRANGGYLVLDAMSVLENPMSWEVLKRTIKNRQVSIEDMGSESRVITTSSVNPEPIPFDAKVILIGDGHTYYALYNHDDDFRKLFKVRADFGTVMPLTDETVRDYARFIAAYAGSAGLLPFDRTAVARLVEYGARLVEHQGRLSTSFTDIVEVVEESSYWARRDGKKVVGGEYVLRALEERVYRLNRAQQYEQQEILDNTIVIRVDGEAVGELNGLQVSSYADYEFGMPTRISAQVYMGKGGLVAVDRDVNLTGPIHNKGTLILQGYMGGKYAQKKPLGFSASVTFEQEYGESDGDSASSAELYALLSGISRIPLRQDLAVTGSVDQYGRVQAIGSVNVKIEGFFDICSARGLTGTQGVIIPGANVRHLMLRPDVIEAVREGKFHVYAVDTIDEGMSLLTGMEAGEPDADGNYPAGTINCAIIELLEKLADEGGDDKTDDDTGGQ